MIVAVAVWMTVVTAIALVNVGNNPGQARYAIISLIHTAFTVLAWASV